MTPSLLPNMKNAQAFTLLLLLYHKFKNIARGKKRFFGHVQGLRKNQEGGIWD